MNPDNPDYLQVCAGTMLRVEEGQACGVLCAADEPAPPHTQTHARRHPHAGPAPPAAHRAAHLSVAAPPGGGTAFGGSTAVGEYGSSSGWGEEDGDGDGDGDNTATAGDASSDAEDTETFSELSDPGGTEVVFVREGVAVWPGPRSERITGRLSLVKQCGVLFMAWLPYSRGILMEDGTFRVAAGPAAAAAGRAAAAGAGKPAAAASGTAGASGAAEAAPAGPHSPGADRTLYAVHPIPLSEVRCLRRRSPPLGLGSPQLLVVLGSGVTLPPLHFTRGGVRALIATLQQHVLLLKSASEPGAYLVNDTADPLCRSLSALQLADVLIGGPPPGASATFEPGGPPQPQPPSPAAPRHPGPASWATPAAGPEGPAPSTDPAFGPGVGPVTGPRAGVGLGGLGLGIGAGLGLGRAVSWCWADQPPGADVAAESNRPESTNGGAEGDVAEGGGGGGGGGWAWPIVEAINKFVQNVRGTASGWIGALDELDDIDRDLYGSYHETSDEQMLLGPDERLPAAAAAASITSAAGSGTGSQGRRSPAPGSRNSLDVTAVGRGGSGGGAAAAAVVNRGGGGGGGGEVDVSTEVGEFELLDGGGCWGEAAAAPHPNPAGRRRVRPPPLSAEELGAMFDAEGRLTNEATLRDRVFASGCAPELRREVWKHLLGVHPRGSTAAERADRAKDLQSEYLTLRQQWQSMTPGQEARCGSWRAHKTAVDKDVRRTDRQHPFFSREGGAGLRALRNVLLSHVMYDQDTGYCQGMSDLAAPLLVVMRDEAEAFWAFAALMARQRANFGKDLAGMGAQLAALRRLVQLLDPPLHAYLERRDCLSYYFAFRWLLIAFKREFKFDDVLCLWEACWACRRTRHLHLYLAVAVLVQNRRLILGSDLDFDGLLRLALSLAGRLELRPLLDTAEALVGYAGEAGREACADLP
ncbi:hypothetical protein HYH03_016187 [Edaphochlamys debaryana]|uniref:Rab-GAP TBC domain-containing protein n=1 Tax=Edaphochlamys debaryana TaxID=47281 RepID=A0A835XQD7_9CHLO|nr:hypothetical protein HYH03_016187 [Edaphochlamys debaryana]|eukprot:KAG2485090.1 hypothetical protein HYH03_016187 [Edaphochlamys debaryana]